MAIPNPFDTSQGISQATKKAAAQTKLTKTGAAKQVDVTKAGYRKGREALAPTLTNVQQLYDQEEAQRKAYIGALGGGTEADRAAAQAQYGNYIGPVDQYGIQDLFRMAGNTGTLASGGTQKDLYDYGYTTRFAPWLQAMSGFNPLGVNAQYGELAGKMAGLDVGQGTDLSGIFGNKFNTLAGIQGNKYDTIAGVQQNAAGNVLNAGIAGVNALGNIAGMAMNPAGAAAGSLTSRLPQYSQLQPNASGTGYSTFPTFM